jgi:hypothetical protein
MARLITIILLACLLPVPANGTLLVIAASASGLVIAADSRTAILGTRCDDQYKITEVRRPHRTAVAVTGNVVFIKPPEARETDVCQYLESAPRMLDIPSVVKTYLEHKVRDFSKLSLEDLASECVAVSQRFQSANPGVFNSAPGGEIFSVVIVNYDRKSKTATIMNFVARIDVATHEIRADRFTHLTISSQSRRGVWSYGETDYLNRYVLGGFGREYLSKSTKDFILVDEPVSKAPLDQAIAATVDIIQAATRAAQIVPAPSGIGGPIDVLLLGKKPQPERIRWKGTAGPGNSTQTPPAQSWENGH